MSSKESAFSKLETWKNSKTVLKVTVVENGFPPDVLECRICGVDPDNDLVDLVFEATRTFQNLDVSGAEFSLEDSVLRVCRGTEDSLTFEERRMV